MGRKEIKKQRLTRKQQREKTRQLIKYMAPLFWAFVTWFALISLVHTPWLRDITRDFFVGFTTHAAYWFGRVLFIPVEMRNVPFLAVKGFNMQVVMECTAYNFYLFALVLTLFARWPLRHKFISLAIFLVVIFILNNMRFITMGYLGSYRPDLFDVVHDYLWNILFGFMVFGIWAWREVMAQEMIKKREVAP
jgi:exosortase/archaeosortase family protein